MLPENSQNSTLITCKLCGVKVAATKESENFLTDTYTCPNSNADGQFHRFAVLKPHWKVFRTVFAILSFLGLFGHFGGGGDHESFF